MNDFGMYEKDIQHYLATSEIAKRNLKKIINLDEENLLFKREESFINGITVDLTIVSENNKIIYSLIECKGSKINVTDYVRGIGQTLQYEYFCEEKIPPKNEQSYSFDENFKVLLIVTSDFMKKTNINIAKFKYPKSVKLVEINTGNKNLREIDTAEIAKINKNSTIDTIALNFYYFRDNRVFELYILLKEIVIVSLTSQNNINRKNLEEKLMQKTVVINNRNWRNAFITLASLGFIDTKNRPSDLGYSLAKLTFDEFAYFVFQNYLIDYFKIILDTMTNYNLLDSRNSEISKKIKECNNEKEILFLTQSNERYISSFLNIMRDDFGIINFKAHSSIRVINYDIFKLNKESIQANIKKYSNAFKYL